MKSWWDYYPVMIFAVVAPFIPGLLPTVSFNGHFIGGGPIRQFFINQVAEILPVETGQRYVDAFNVASFGGEVALYLPIALNMAACLVLVVYAFYSGLIQVSNWMKRGEFKSQRKASKGA